MVHHNLLPPPPPLPTHPVPKKAQLLVYTDLNKAHLTISFAPGKVIAVRHLVEVRSLVVTATKKAS